MESCKKTSKDNHNCLWSSLSSTILKFSTNSIGIGVSFKEAKKIITMK